MRKAVALLWLALSPVCPARDDIQDPPERVAVVNLLEGAAAVQPAGVGDWSADLVNRPLTTGDRVWIDADSRAELQLGSAAIRLGANTGLQFLDVGDRGAQLRLSAGSMNIRLRNLSPDETVEIDTPNTAVSLSVAGEYRIDVRGDGDDVAVGVWRGVAEIGGETQSFTLESQQQGEFRGSGTLGVEFRDLPPSDALDQWAQYLDQREDESLAANFMSRDVTGYAALDGYGQWQNEPELGAVWQPQVPVGWAPYSQGYWASIAPWGQTWVDRAPWGFAPFHYGRWVHLRSGWVWCPGPRSLRPVYAPALVVSVDAGGGKVGWLPLGYNEIYRPARRVSDGYLRRVNVTNTHLNNTPAIDNRDGTSANYASQAISGATVHVAQQSGRLGSPAAPPAAIFTRPVVARTAPPIARNPDTGALRLIVTTTPRAEPRSPPVPAEIQGESLGKDQVVRKGPYKAPRK